MREGTKYRSDISRFLVHLTKGKIAKQNLISILNERQVKAGNFHCLFKPKIAKSDFTKVLRNKFKTVCFTETPLHQIAKLTRTIRGRNIDLKPYGVVFWKDTLIKNGANPAIYINESGTHLKNFLLNEFDCYFSSTRSFKKLRKENDEYYKEIIQYFSLINVMGGDYDFSWEREWRINGHFKVNDEELVAVIADDPDSFKEDYESQLSKEDNNILEYIPVISPKWGYEEIIEVMSYKIWDIAQKP